MSGWSARALPPAQWDVYSEAGSEVEARTGGSLFNEAWPCELDVEILNYRTVSLDDGKDT